MPSPSYVLDTDILVHLIRDDAIGHYVNDKYELTEQALWPVICVVSHGEILSIAQQFGWGEEKVKRMGQLLDDLVTVDISHPDVLRAYAEVDVKSQRHAEGARRMGKNDLWISAVTRVSGGTLITTDKDFDHLHPDVIRVERIDLELFRGTQSKNA